MTNQVPHTGHPNLEKKKEKERIIFQALIFFDQVTKIELVTKTTTSCHHIM